MEQSDVRLFVHDSPPYIVAAAKVREVVFDGAYLLELKEFHRLIQLLFARSPFWRTKLCKFQAAAMENWTKVHEQLSGDVKERHEKEKPSPVKSVGILWVYCFRC